VNSGIAEQRTTSASLVMRLLIWVIRLAPKILPDAGPELLEQLRSRPAPKDAPMPSSFNKRFQVERWSAEGQDCVTLHPKSGPGTQHIIYLHGGAFVFPLYKFHWSLAAALVETTGASITVLLYNVVPQSSHRDAEALADAVFREISSEWPPARVAICGDSAGGNMAAALALRLAAGKGEQAGKLILFAPWLDVALVDEKAREVEPHDVMLKIEPLRVMGELWAGDRRLDDALVSPLYASQEQLRALPPTAIFQGQHDIFVVDSRSYAERAKAAGNPVELYEYAAAPHVFMALTMTREAKDCFQLMREFMER